MQYIDDVKSIIEGYNN